jgi:hypothetical protein
MYTEREGEDQRAGQRGRTNADAEERRGTEPALPDRLGWCFDGSNGLCEEDDLTAFSTDGQVREHLLTLVRGHGAFCEGAKPLCVEMQAGLETFAHWGSDFASFNRNAGAVEACSTA